jgi:hypothetical protein
MRDAHDTRPGSRLAILSALAAAVGVAVASSRDRSGREAARLEAVASEELAASD